MNLEREFERFVREHYDRAFATAFRILGDKEDAMDAVQEAFLKAWKARSRFRGDASPGTWLHRIVVNCARDILRASIARRRKEVSSEIPEHVVSREDDPMQVASRKEMAALVAAAVESLPARQREVFVLRHMEELSIREIADITGMAEGTVKVHLHRAVMALRKVLSNHEL